MAEHNTLTGTQLHEPKGVAAATAGEVYVADGAGSGTWSSPATSSSLDYGGLYSIHTDGVTIGTIGTTAKKLLAFSHDSPSNGITPAHANDEITILTTGDYFVPLTITFETSAVSDAGIYQFHVRVDGIESVIGLHRSMSGSSDVGSGAAQGILSLTAGEVLSVWVESDNGANADDIDINMIDLSAYLLKAA